MTTTSFPSKSNPDVKYTVVIAQDGQLGCNCKGWTIKRAGQPRHCTHTKQVVADMNLTIEERGEYVHVVVTGNETAPVSSIPAKPVETNLMAAVQNSLAGCPANRRPMLAVPLKDGVDRDAFLASLVGDPNWVIEEKFDGHRVIVIVKNDGFECTVEAWSRPRAGKDPLRRKLPTYLVEQLKQLHPGTYDGEFYIPGGKSFNVTDLTQEGSHVYVIYDILERLGASLTQLPYAERREHLAEAFPNAELPHVYISKAEPVTVEFVHRIWAAGGEGAILKHVRSLYRPGMRCTEWIKIKKIGHAVTTITGWTAGKCGPYSVTNVVDEWGNETTVRTLNNQLIDLITANPDAFIGRKLVIEFTERLGEGRGASYREGHWDHFAEETE